MKSHYSGTIALALVALVALTGACAGARPAPDTWASLAPAFAPGQRIVDVSTGSEVAPDDAATRLREGQAIYIGEEAGIPFHAEIAAQIVGLLAADTPAPTVILDRIPADLQAVVDGWIGGTLPDAALEATLRGGACADREIEAFMSVLRLCREASLRVVASGAGGASERALASSDGLDSDVPAAWRAMVEHRVKDHEHRSGADAAHAADRLLRHGERLRDAVAEALDRGGRVIVVADHVFTDQGLGVPLPVFERTRAPFRVVLPVTRGHLKRHDGELLRLSFPDKRADLLWESPTDPHGDTGPAPDEARLDRRGDGWSAPTRTSAGGPRHPDDEGPGPPCAVDGPLASGGCGARHGRARAPGRGRSDAGSRRLTRRAVAGLASGRLNSGRT